MKAIIQRLFGHQSGRLATFLRISVKTAICYTVARVVWDFVSHIIPQRYGNYMRVYNSIDYGGLILPPLITEYPDTPSGRQQKQLHDRLLMNAVTDAVGNVRYRARFYNDHPERENPDRVDHYLLYSTVNRRRNLTQLMLASRMENEGAQMKNINTVLRRQEQCVFDQSDSPVIPLL